jgi:hypothetical protein
MDDIILIDQGIVDIKECSGEFKTKDLGTPTLFPGIQIERCKGKAFSISATTSNGLQLGNI